MDQENQVSEDADFLQEMENLLSQHDYEQPRVGDIRQAVIVSIGPQGIIVDLGLKRDGFIQISDLEKLDPVERAALAVNDEVPVYVVNVDNAESLEVSLSLARLNEDWVRAQELLDSGEVFETEITGHNRGGALVPFGRLRGFIPASHLAFINPGMNEQQRQQRIAEAQGQTIPVKVIEVDRRRRRLVLSHREADRLWQERRRKELMETLNEGDVLKGRITGWRDFGAFVDLGGADGLIHVSELAWQRVDHPKEVVRMGQEVEVYVLKVDRKRERISLSRKKLLPNPWGTVEERYEVGQLVEGRVIRVVDYGAFVEVEPGIEGLLHASQISRTSIGDPREVLREGENHLLRIISIDGDRQRMGLSLKAVTAAEQIEWMTRHEVQADEDVEDEEPAEVVEMEAVPAESDEEPDETVVIGEEERADVVEMEDETVVIGEEERADVVEMEDETVVIGEEERADVVEMEDETVVIGEEERADVVEMEDETVVIGEEERADVVEMEDETVVIGEEERADVVEMEDETVVIGEEERADVVEMEAEGDEAGENNGIAAAPTVNGELTEEPDADEVTSA